MEGKAKVALTFALYQGDQLVRRETVDAGHRQGRQGPEEPPARRRRARVAHARGHRGRRPERHHAHRSRQRAGHDGERRSASTSARSARAIRSRSAATMIELESAELAGARVGAPPPAPPPPGSPQVTRRPRRCAARGGSGGANPLREPARSRRRTRSPPAQSVRAQRAAARRRRPIRSRRRTRSAAVGEPVRARRTRSSRRRRAGAAATASTRRAARLRSEPAVHVLARQERPRRPPGRGRDATSAAVEVMVLWDQNTLHVAHLTPPRSFYVGEERQELRLRLLRPEREARHDARADRPRDAASASRSSSCRARAAPIEIPGQPKITVQRR